MAEVSALSDCRIGFIGVGNMGVSILSGALAAGVVDPGNVRVFDVRREWAAETAKRHAVRAADDLRSLMAESELLLYAAKPQNLPEIRAQIAADLRADQWVLTIAAGIRTATWEEGISLNLPVVRVMPNIAASVRESMTAICGGAHADEKHLAAAEELFAAVGKTVRLPEGQMDVVTGLSASGPGFAFLIIEALADAGVQLGLTFDQARLLSSQMLLGSARMALEAGEHPAVLKTRVTSPGGTTAAGLAALEEGGLRTAIARAVKDATERAKQLGSG